MPTPANSGKRAFTKQAPHAIVSGMSVPREPLELHGVWRRCFSSALTLAIGLYLCLFAIRAYGYLGNYFFQSTPVMLSYLIMWALPFLILSPNGRQQIGLGLPLSFKWLMLAIASGSALAYLCYLLGILLFGKTDQNWFVSIAFALQSDARIAEMPRHIAFFAFTIPAMLASPIGEELYYRGLVERSFRDRFSPVGAACCAAGLFALAHSLEHGIHRSVGGIEVMPLSGTLWFGLMFATSLLFSYLRQRGASLWTAVAAHSAFNLVTHIAIFYSLFVSETMVNQPLR